MLNHLSIILLLIALTLIFYQDYKERAVHLVSFFLLLVGIIGFRNFQLDVLQIGLNYGFLFTNIIVVFLYLKLRFKIDSIVSIGKYLGLGDLVFWALVALLMPFSVFLVFFLTGLLFSLLASLMIINRSKSVPLAGLQALWLVIWLVIDIGFMKQNLILTDWLYLIY